MCWAPLLAVVAVTVPIAVLPIAGTDISPNEHWEVVGQQGGEKVRHASGAGMWYPADSSHLRETVDAYIMANPSTVQEKPVALIAKQPVGQRPYAINQRCPKLI